MLVNHSNIIEKIKSDGDIGFVSFVRTPWHAIGCNASLLRLKKEQGVKKGLIILSSESCKSENPLVRADSFDVLHQNEISFDLMFHDGNVFSQSKAENIKTKLSSLSYLVHHKKGTRRIYVLSPMNLNDIFISRLKKAVPEADIVSVVIDEGLGVYMRSSFNWAVEQYNNMKSVKEFIRSLFDMQKKRAYVKLSSKRNEYISNNLLLKNGREFIENSDIISFYKQAVESDRADADKYRIYENAAVISAQLYFENGQIKNDADLKVYKEIISRLTEKGIHTVFKPHPRDKNLSRYDCLGCYVDKDNTVSQEKIFASLNVKPCAVLSFTSTSLVTSELFYDVKAFSLNRILDKDDIQLTLQNEFSNFEKAFENVVSIPKTINALIEYIVN